jgi:hypothetical protein
MRSNAERLHPPARPTVVKEVRMSNLKPQVQHSMLCTEGESCSRRAPGHGLSPIQLLASGATPGKWQDAFVAAVEADGWIAIELFTPGSESTTGAAATLTAPPETVWLWSHDTPRIDVGTPVALHGLYNTLAVGSARISVVVAGSL